MTGIDPLSAFFMTFYFHYQQSPLDNIPHHLTLTIAPVAPLIYSHRKKDMDAFEQIIGQLLVEEKYWVRHSVKIDLTPEEKRSINKPSTPRPEIDISTDHILFIGLHFIIPYQV